jgi:tRNA G10  N-methylase Trm11
LLDPFCGVGTILQEALLEGVATVGIDVNSWCVKAAEENLEWIAREYELQGADFRVLQGDIGRLAEKVGLETVNCIVSEPDLGPALKQFPTSRIHKRLLKNLNLCLRFHRASIQSINVTAVWCLLPPSRPVLVSQ